jgi:protein-arginine kinase activator protein McsA|tara:strand:- start:268 stop:567 length:300 start_codon:yes stop_codon:yes gene_type:complete
MIYSVNVKNHEEFEDLVYSKDLNISKVIVDKIFDNLETTKRFIYVLKITIEEGDRIIDLTLDRNDFIDTLEKNIQIHAYHEEYERCAEIRDAIEKLKNK